MGGEKGNLSLPSSLVRSALFCWLALSRSFPLPCSSQHRVGRGTQSKFDHDMQMTARTSERTNERE